MNNLEFVKFQKAAAEVVSAFNKSIEDNTGQTTKEIYLNDFGISFAPIAVKYDIKDEELANLTSFIKTSFNEKWDEFCEKNGGNSPSSGQIDIIVADVALFAQIQLEKDVEAKKQVSTKESSHFPLIPGEGIDLT